MGLDMYLYKKTYVRNWDHMEPGEKHVFKIKMGDGSPCTQIKPERISEVTEHVAYWRKANHIHKWFVDNVQDGNDDCGEYYVERGQLQSLVDLCKEVLGSIETVPGTLNTGTTYHPDGTVEHHTRPGEVVAQAGLAKKLLPTASGFFFGSTDYDEGYLTDVRETIAMLEPLIAEEGGDFYYTSSW